jgi:nucleoside-diphosphate-sugar epimerase
MMRVLVIGGTGFIGPHVARELCQRNHEVTLYHRGDHETVLAPGARHFKSEKAAMPVVDFPQELLGAGFEIVIHMIAMGERDARAVVRAFTGRAQRLVVLSSGDVYRAYGRFTRIEPGPIEEGLLTEESPLRSALFPYRAQANSASDLNYFYEKILVEREAQGQADLPATILRLPKVFGPGSNADLATVYRNRNCPSWRWTHGYVENVAAAIALAALHPAASGQIYNVGEAYTPTIAERLKSLPASSVPGIDDNEHDFRQNIAYDTTRIRAELGYAELVSDNEAIRRTLGPG